MLMRDEICAVVHFWNLNSVQRGEMNRAGAQAAPRIAAELPAAILYPARSHSGARASPNLTHVLKCQ